MVKKEDYQLVGKIWFGCFLVYLGAYLTYISL